MSNRPLTERELDVARLITEGHTNPEIAGELGLSVSTVSNHVMAIYHKLNLEGRLAIAKWYRDQQVAA